MRSWRYRGLRRRKNSSRVISGDFSIYIIFWRWNHARRCHVGPRRYQGAPGGVARPGASLALGGPPLVGLGSSIFYLSHKKSPKSFIQFQELLFLHKNNTMAILLKTASVRVSSIQIMDIRVQNKGKNVWKSRYDGDVSVIKTFFWRRCRRVIAWGEYSRVCLFALSLSSFILCSCFLSLVMGRKHKIPKKIV